MVFFYPVDKTLNNEDDINDIFNGIYYNLYNYLSSKNGVIRIIFKSMVKNVKFCVLQFNTNTKEILFYYYYGFVQKIDNNGKLLFNVTPNGPIPIFVEKYQYYRLKQNIDYTTFLKNLSAFIINYEWNNNFTEDNININKQMNIKKTPYEVKKDIKNPLIMMAGDVRSYVGEGKSRIEGNSNINNNGYINRKDGMYPSFFKSNFLMYADYCIFLDEYLSFNYIIQKIKVENGKKEENEVEEIKLLIGKKYKMLINFDFDYNRTNNKRNNFLTNFQNFILTQFNIYPNQGGSLNKISILGRQRKIIKVGRKKCVTYKGKQITLSEAKALEKNLKKS